MALTTTQIQTAYVAFFNRPADVAGINYWSQANLTLANLYSTFAASSEYLNLFSGLNNTQKVTTMYSNLLGRAPDVAGLNYWVLQLDNGAVKIADLALAIVNGALGTDRDTINNKVTASAAFTASLDTAVEITDYASATAAGLAAVKTWLAGVTDATSLASATSTTSVDTLNNYLALNNTTVSGGSQSLTTSPDSIVVTSTGTVDTVKGFFDATAANTFSVNDTITGNGKTVVQVVVNADGAMPYATMTGVDKIAVIAGSTNVTNTWNASNYGTDISYISLSGSGNGNEYFSNVSAKGQLNVSVANATASYLSATGVNDGANFYAYVTNAASADGVGGSVDFGAGSITLVAGKNDSVFLSYSHSASGSAAAGETVGAIKTGNITVTAGVSAYADASITNYAYNNKAGLATAGDITVGNVKVTAATSGSAYAYQYNEAYTVKGNATVGNTTIGNVTVSAGKSAYASWEVTQSATVAVSGAAALGNITVGTITLNAGTNATAYAEIQNTDYSAKGSATVGNIVVGDVTMTAGKTGSASLDITNTASAAGGAATAGNITVGKVNMTIGTKGTGTFTISNAAYTTGKGAATVGNLTIGDITASVGKSGTLDLEFSQYASAANTGAAKVGNVTIGNVNVTIAKSATGLSTFSVYNSAVSHKGAATAGNVTLGNITVTAGDNVSYGMYGYFYNYAFAHVSGAATVGNTKVGDVSVTVGNGADTPATLFVSAYASADKGDATVGNMTVGNVTMTVGNNATASATTAHFSAYQFATVSATGNAKVGDITVGNLNMSVGTSNNIYVYVSETAQSAKGSATVGNVTVGNITETGVLGAYLWNRIAATASGTATAGDSVGNVKVGNVDMYGQPKASVDLSVSAYAHKGSVGNVTVGNVSQKVDASGHVYDWFYVKAGKAVGDVSLGNINVTLGNTAYASYVAQSVHAGTDISSYKIGNVTISGGVNSYDSNVYQTVAATGKIGSITTGDVTVTAGKGAAFDSLTSTFTAGTTIGAVVIGNNTLTAGVSASIDNTMNITAGTSITSIKVGNVTLSGAKNAFLSSSNNFVATAGAIGDVTLGNHSITAGSGASATAYLYYNVTAGTTIGNVTVGNVTLSAAKSGSAWSSVNLTSTGTIGTVTQGNVTVTATGKNAFAGQELWMDANAHKIGAVTVGDVSLSAKGTSATASAEIYATHAGDTVASVKVGNVSLTVENVKAATAAASVLFTANVLGDLTVGNIAVNAVAGTALYANTATTVGNVVLTTSGNLVLGNISVTGGSKNSTPTQLDNLDTLTTWMTLTHGTGKTTTIGNVDYSGYKLASTIDVSGFLGAGVIKASSGGSTITDNLYKNDITLGAGADTINMVANSSKVGGTATTVSTDATTLDVVRSFTSGTDHITVDVATTTYNFDFISAADTSYASFLTHAGSAMTNFGDTVYARVVGSDTYVAFDSNVDHTVDFVIKLAGITSVQASDFSLV